MLIRCDNVIWFFTWPKLRHWENMLGKVHPLVVDHCQSCSLDLTAHSEQITVLFTSVVNVRKPSVTFISDASGRICFYWIHHEVGDICSSCWCVPSPLHFCFSSLQETDFFLLSLLQEQVRIGSFAIQEAQIRTQSEAECTGAASLGETPTPKVKVKHFPKYQSCFVAHHGCTMTATI